MKLLSIAQLRGQIEVLTGLHIGAGDLEMRIGGVDNSVVRDGRSGKPYIPGSSLKGKIRSLLEWRSGCVQSAPLSLDSYRKAGDAAPQVLAILRLFGVSGDAELDYKTAPEIGPTRVSISDAQLLGDGEGANAPVTEVKSENRIDRVRGVAEHPRHTERVVAGVRFDFRASVKRLENDDDLVGLLLEGMRLLELDSLGGSGSRGYGKVRFVELTLDEQDIQGRYDSISPFGPGVAA